MFTIYLNVKNDFSGEMKCKLKKSNYGRFVRNCAFCIASLTTSALEL